MLLHDNRPSHLLGMDVAVIVIRPRLIERDGNFLPWPQVQRQPLIVVGCDRVLVRAMAFPADFCSRGDLNRLGLKIVVVNLYLTWIRLRAFRASLAAAGELALGVLLAGLFRRGQRVAHLMNETTGIVLLLPRQG